MFLRAIGDDHPLMDLIHKSINNLQLAQEREINKSLMAGNHELQSILSKLRLENATLQHTISELHTAAVDKDYIIQMKDALVRRKNSDLEAKNRALEEKDATISAMSEQITKIRDYLANKQQVNKINVIVRAIMCTVAQKGHPFLQFFKVTFCKLSVFQFCTFANMQFVNQALLQTCCLSIRISTPTVRDVQ